MSISEFALIGRYFAARSQQRADVALGIGDDGALLVPPVGQHLVATVDTLVSGVHFFADVDPASLGHKTLAVNLSDLAAMGAAPAWAMLALTLPAVDENWLGSFCQGLFALADRYQVELIGGDTTCGSAVVITLQAQGFVPLGLALRRDGARPGDGIYVSGSLGDAGLALAAAFGKAVVAPEYRAYLQQRLERPEPRVDSALSLRGIASAAIDISDGLAQDLSHILQRSGVGAQLEVDRLPLSPALVASVDRDAALQMALSGGDDYELCFTVPTERAALLAAAITNWNCHCTRIGTITEHSGLQLRRADGSIFVLACSGYNHFHSSV